ncbi:hypothetical protein EYF80_036043 [Liparis tanakae]|uniref:Uncharacterized protein n=1 Tax=Liparis tanakae TaxID=230148 RepID=A0A4Z2GLN6_9TELE|nr:hypothetical protein EYF80_036043 [Liparis tanakae]
MSMLHSGAVGTKGNQSAVSTLIECTLMSRLQSCFTRILLPTISLGNTRSSKMASWTAVRVRLKEEPRDTSTHDTQEICA